MTDKIKEILDNLSLELKRGTLVLAVLSQVNVPTYGYILVQNLEQKGITIDPSTLYPLMRRLEAQGLLESIWETTGNKPRKYYNITIEGKEIYKLLSIEWKELNKKIEFILKEDN